MKEIKERLEKLVSKGILTKIPLVDGTIEYEFSTSDFATAKKHIETGSDAKTVEEFEKLEKEGIDEVYLSIRFWVHNEIVICGAGLSVRVGEEWKWIYKGWNPFGSSEFYTEAYPEEEIEFLESLL